MFYNGPMSTVVGIGQCSYDYLALVDGFPVPDEKHEAIEMLEQAGGPVATALVALRRLGVPACFYGVVGSDEAGEHIVRSLDAEGVEARVVRREGMSQTAYIIVERGSGRRTIIWRRPGGVPLRSGELDDGFLDGAAFLHLDGLMPEVSLYAARAARERGVPVMLDAGRMREGMRELAGLSDYVVASERFAHEVGIGDALEDPAAFKDRARGMFIAVFTVTMGARGSMTLAGNEAIHQRAFDVQTVDTTGAGDVFHGGYIYGVLQGWDIRRTLRFASALAAMKCTKPGGRTGIPAFEEVERFLSERGNF
jgi:sulfofructose kinase